MQSNSAKFVAYEVTRLSGAIHRSLSCLTLAATRHGRSSAHLIWPSVRRFCAWFMAISSLGAAQPNSSPNAASEKDVIYSVGRQLFEEYAPEEVKKEYEFPSPEQWNDFVTKLQGALQSDSLDDLAGYAPEGKALLASLRAAGVEPDLADWLEQRIDEIDGAQEVRAVPSPRVPSAPVPSPNPPSPSVTKRVPHYDMWLTRVRSRPAPSRAAELLPKLRAAFAAEGVPPALVWLAEAESSFNPMARSPAGAKGLFQLMPDTAKMLGLGTFLPDERVDPEKSARAAARYLRSLREKFGSWPLALAAYNAGEGRVSRTLASRKANDYAAIADALPAETRMYVPKVCALVSLRGGTNLTAM